MGDELLGILISSSIVDLPALFLSQSATLHKVTPDMCEPER
jgi:hypothetical protein